MLNKVTFAVLGGTIAPIAPPWIRPWLEYGQLANFCAAESFNLFPADLQSSSKIGSDRCYVSMKRTIAGVDGIEITIPFEECGSGLMVSHPWGLDIAGIGNCELFSCHIAHD